MILKAIKTIEEAETVLRERYNVDSFGPRPESDKEYFLLLMEMIMDKEDQNIKSILNNILGDLDV